MTSTQTLRIVPWLSLAMLLAFSGAAAAEVIHPAPPKEYDVTLRFQIRAPLPGWYDRFDETVAVLKRVGFVREPLPEGEQEDPSNDRLHGIIASDNARKLLGHAAVQTILLKPRGLKLNQQDRVKVRLELYSGMSLDRQQKLTRQAMDKLTPLGFREALGYDHRGYTWIVGTIEAGRLDTLLQDLRKLPAGWLVPQEPISTLEMPLRNQVPVRVIEVLPEPGDVPPPQEPAAPPMFPEDQQHLAKIAPDLRALIGMGADDSKRLRVEAVLARTPPEGDDAWERLLRNTASSVVVEGRIGNIATVQVRPTQAGEVARPIAVLHVRLPRSGEPFKRPAAAGPAVNALAETRLDRLHERGQRGGGVKVVVVAGDFGGYEQFVGRGLPRKTQLIDFTAPRNPSLEPDPMPSTDGAIGQGTLSALATAKAAPDVDLVLVRIDPAAAHQLLLLAQILNEPGILPRVLEERYNELVRDRAAIDEARVRAVDERRRALRDQVFDEGDPKVPEQRKRYLESQERIKRAEQALKDLDKLEADLRKRTQNFLLRKADLQELQGTRVVVCPLTWNSGYPLDGASALSRYFDEKPFIGHPGEPTRSRIASLQKMKSGTVWVQAGGDSRGQAWAGLFRDEDGNGAMEFAPPSLPLPRGRWTSELGFLAWQDYNGMSAPDLPAKVRLRVSMQWREPHDAALFNSTDDPYRTPIAPLSLLVVKQRDPSGTKLASDDMELIARTSGTAVRLQLAPNIGTYEMATEFEASAGGRFAIRIEGRMPTSTRPGGESAGQSALPLEIRPRILIEVLDAVSRVKGRAVLADYAGDMSWPPVDPAKQPPGMQHGGVGMPADARSVLSIGAADAAGKSQYYSALGAGPARELMVKPDLLGFDAIELGNGLRSGGSWVATSFSGGLVACLIGSSGPAQTRQLLQVLHLPSGSVLRVPEDWLK